MTKRKKRGESIEESKLMLEIVCDRPTCSL